MKELRASNPAEKIESYVYENTFGFTNDKRRLEIKNRFGDKVIWIDLKESRKWRKETVFPHCASEDGPKMHLEDNIPSDPAEFKRRKQSPVGVGRGADQAG